MGVSELWSLLRSEAMVREWNCETNGQKAQKVLAEKLEGKVVAVDISLWTCQAFTQGVLKEVLESDEQRVVKVAFDRVSYPNEVANDKALQLTAYEHMPLRPPTTVLLSALTSNVDF